MIGFVLLLLIGIPAIVLLTGMAVRRARALGHRIAVVREEMARDPRPPYMALAEIMQEQEQRNKGK